MILNLLERVITRPTRIPNVFSAYSAEKKFLPKLGVHVPRRVDWRRIGLGHTLPQVFDTCWATSTKNNLQVYAPLIGKKLALSVEKMYGCDHRCSCDGGDMEFLLQYCISHGVLTPRVDGDPFPSFGSKVPLSGYIAIPLDKEYLMRAVAQQPVLLTLKHGYDFSTYDGGLFQGDYSDVLHESHHVVNCVGYGDDDTSGEYFIIQNSWEDDWGEHGFMRVTPEGLNTMLVRCFMPFIQKYTTDFNAELDSRYFMQRDHTHLGCFCPRDRKSVAINHRINKYPKEYLREFAIEPKAYDKDDVGSARRKVGHF